MANRRGSKWQPVIDQVRAHKASWPIYFGFEETCPDDINFDTVTRRVRIEFDRLGFLREADEKHVFIRIWNSADGLGFYVFKEPVRE